MDMVGVLFKGERKYMIDGVERTITVTDPSCPLWYMMTDGLGGPPQPAFMFDRCFLILDEYGQGEPDTKRSAAEILLNGGTAPWYLPPGSVRVGATNVGPRYGVTKDFDFCIARRTAIHIDPDAELWLAFADKPYVHQGRKWQTTPVIKAWAKNHPDILFEGEPKEQGPWCNPRQLCAVDRYLQVKWEDQGNTEVDANTITAIAGTIGQPAAQSLLAHLEFMLQLPAYEDVVADPKGTPRPTKADMQMLMAYQLASYAKSEHLAQVIEYMTTPDAQGTKMPKDMSITFISALLRRDYKGIVNHPAMQAWIAKNATLVTVLSALSQ
jgi:hypothetical protein